MIRMLERIRGSGKLMRIHKLRMNAQPLYVSANYQILVLPSHSNCEEGIKSRVSNDPVLHSLYPLPLQIM